MADPTLTAPLSHPIFDGDMAEDDPEPCRQPNKRQKKCPKALEKIKEFVPSNQSCSFTSNTKSSACGSEMTPKFGSINSAKEPTNEKNQTCEIRVEKKEEEDEEGGDEVREDAREVVRVLTVGIE